MLTTADSVLASHDYRSAWLLANQALSLNPENPAALKIMVGLYSNLENPAAIGWQERVSRALPDQANEQLKLARLALKFEETGLASNTLASIPAGQQNTVDFHLLKSSLAIAKGQPQPAFDEAKNALALEPDNAVLQMNLATLELNASDPKVAETARLTLQKLSEFPVCRADALRSLFADAQHRKQPAEARKWAEQLSLMRGATLQDQFRFFEILRTENPQTFPKAFSLLKQKAAESSNTVFDVMCWMNKQGMALETLSWAGELPKKVCDQMPVAMAIAEALATTQSWEELRRLVFQGNWGSMEFLRRAYRAHATTNGVASPQNAGFTHEWDRAVYETKSEFRQVTALAKTVASWGWKDQSAELWWILASQSSGQRGALRQLNKIYSDTKDTGGMLRVATRILEIEPKDPIAKNNVAMLLLLTQQDLPKARRMALENFTVFSAEPACITTQAFSLFQQGDISNARALLRKLPATALQQPSCAAYYGIILAAAGEKDEAKRYLELADQSGTLLPGEAKLVTDALISP